MRLAEIKYQDLQNRVQRPAGRLDRRDVAVFKRGEDRARGGVDRRQK